MMKERLIRLFAALLTVILMAAPVYAAAVPETGAMLTALHDAELRAGPGENYHVVGVLSAGESVEFSGIDMTDKLNKSWYAVNFGKKVVWICSTAFSESAESESTPTPVPQPTAALTAAPTAAPTAEPTAVPTAEPTSVPQPTAALTAAPTAELTAVPTAEPTPVPVATPPAMAENSIGRYTGSYAVEASSYRRGNNPAVYGSCAADSDLVSAWNTHDSISGEWLKLSVKDGRTYQIGGIRIANGYWKNNSVYTENSRLKDFDVYCDGVYVTSARLEDVKSFQTVWFDQPVTGSSLKLVVSSGYRGSLYRDLCITEIELLGPGGQQLIPELLRDWGGSVLAAEEKARSGRIEKGSRGMAVVGLQLLLKEGFGILEGNVHGSFGSGTQGAVQVLAGRIQNALPDCEPMTDGVVDAAFWRNMLEYMRTLQPAG